MNLRRYWPLLLALPLVAALAWALRAPARLVEIATVRAAPFVDGFEEEGRTHLRHRYLLAAPVAGTLRRIVLEPGDAVQAGVVVAQLEPASGGLLDAASLAQTRAERAAAEAAVRAAQQRAAAAASAAALAEREAARLADLGARRLASAAELDRARSAASQTAGEREAAAAETRVAAQRLAAIDALLARQGRGGGEAIALAAPIHGVVLKRYQESAVPVAVGTPLLEFGDPQDLDIEVEALSQDAVRLAPGMAARVLRWGGDAPLAARVTRIEPGGFTKTSALGVEEQRTRVRLEIASPPEQWRRLGDAYRVEVEFVLREASQALQVPASALFREDGRWLVYRVVDGRARRTAVGVGGRAALAAEILDGLAAGDAVIAHPDDQVAEGVRVRAVR